MQVGQCEEYYSEKVFTLKSDKFTIDVLCDWI